MVIKESERYCGCYRYDYLKSQGFNKFFRVGNIYVAMKMDEDIPPVISIKELSEIPLWERHMNLMIGKGDRQYRENIVSYRTFKVPDARYKHWNIYEKVW